MTPLPEMTELVPHAPPMLALSELLEWEPGRARARLQVRPDNYFVRDGRLDTVVMLEYMAQGVAACLGYDALRAGARIRVGMVIACRKMTIARPSVAVGSELLVTVRCIHGSDYASHYDAEVTCAEGLPVATATLTLVHGDRPPDDLTGMVAGGTETSGRR